MHQFSKHTGQIWKHRVCQVAFVGAVVASVAFLSLWNGNPARLPEGLTILLYFPVTIFWFAWWAFAIRCPTCGEAPVWHQMRHGDASDAVARIMAITVCPACGFDPEPASTTRPDRVHKPVP